jgi:hypothetical protein
MCGGDNYDDGDGGGMINAHNILGGEPEGQTP